MNNTVLNWNVSADNPGDNHAPRMSPIPDDRVGSNHDRVLAVVELDRSLVAEACTGNLEKSNCKLKIWIYFIAAVLNLLVFECTQI
jgi:hypothetical protein